MRGPQRASAALDADLERLDQQHLVVVELDELEDLVASRDEDAFALRRGPYRTGIEDLALTLAAARRLPDDLTVRVVLPPGTSPTVATEQAQAALRQRAGDAASASWRDAMAVRSMGRRQLPIGGPVAVGCAILAYGAGYLATVVDNITAKGILVVVAMIAITVAWVVSWMVIESSMLDWRQLARQSDAFDLLARAALEVVTRDPGSTPDV